MVHEIAVHLKIDVVTVEIIIPRVFHPFGDDIAHIVKGIGIVDVPFVEIEFGTVAHDVAPDEGVVDDILDVVDRIGLGGVDVVGDFGPFLSGFHCVGHFGVKITHIVQITHHLGGRVFGTYWVVINGFPTEFFVGPLPNLALGSPF